MTADNDSSRNPVKTVPRAQATTKDVVRADGAGSDIVVSDGKPSGSDIVADFDIESVPIDRRGPLTGKLLEQRYLIKEKLGVGGMGVVYRAEHTLMRKEMAVKVLLPQYGNFEGIKKRFHREAQSSSRLDHPGITHINDFGETDDGLLFIAMEFLSGKDLTDIIRKDAPLSVDRAIRIAMQICLALDHAHTEGVVHRDLKPDNVMLVEKTDRDDVVKILDFGIAKITQGDGSADALTEVGMVFGTPEYLSPEQAAGQTADARADLYSLGVIMYELLTGSRPFKGPTKLELIGKHISEEPQPMRKRAPDLKIPEELDDVVLHLLAKRPDERIQSAAELFQTISSLDSVQTDPQAMWPANTLTMTNVQPVPLPSRRRRGRRALLLGGVLGVLAAVVVVVALMFTGRWGNSRGIVGAPKPTADAVGKRVPNAQLQGVQAKLVAGSLKDARLLLDRLADQFPTDARVHLLMARVHFLSKKSTECLRSLKEAVRLDKTMRSNEQVLSSVYAYLTQLKGGRGWKLRRAAMDFVERYLDAGAKTMLSRFANTWWERKTVWRAIAFLTKYNAADQVNYPHAYELVFRHEPSCSKRKQHLKDVLRRKDPAFLPLMRKIAATLVWSAKYSRRKVTNKCIEAEAKAAVTVLEALDTEGKYPAKVNVVRPRAMAPAPRKRPKRRRPRRRSRRRRR